MKLGWIVYIHLKCKEGGRDSIEGPTEHIELVYGNLDNPPTSRSCPRDEGVMELLAATDPEREKRLLATFTEVNRELISRIFGRIEGE